MTGQRAATQEKYPWKAVARTVLQLVIGLAVSAPLLVAALTGESVEAASGRLAVFLSVSAATTRLMAVPFVNEFLQRIGLGPEPRAKDVIPDSALTNDYREAVARDREVIYPDAGK